MGVDIQPPRYMWQKCPHCNKPIEIVLQNQWSGNLHLAYLDPITTTKNTLSLIRVRVRKGGATGKSEDGTTTTT